VSLKRVVLSTVICIYLMHCDKLTAMAMVEMLQKVLKDLLLCYGEADYRNADRMHLAL